MTTDPVASRSFYPGSPRKTRARQVLDSVAWVLRHREVNLYYYQYGLDRRDSDAETVIPYRRFKKIRDRANFASVDGKGWNYVCLMRDKWLFETLAVSLGYPTPRTVAALTSRSCTWYNTRQETALAEVTSHADGLRGFVKPFDGIAGGGAFSLDVRDGRLHVDGEPATIKALAERIHGRSLLQERILQHEQLAALHPTSINTLRIVTAREGHDVVPLTAALRIGSGGRSVDNWATGGIAVLLDPKRGELRGEGTFKKGDGGRVRRHPDSGIILDGYPVPYAAEALNLVQRFHADLPGLHSIGWDIAITPTGPMIVEGNDNWEGGIPMVLDPGFKRRFLELHAQPRASSGH